jgi:[protein-PII] uridylyltransferase
MGLADGDTATLARLVRLHLLLPDVATRRDVTDPGTLELVAEAVGDVGTLRLLAALTEADSLATSPAAWGSWKAGLVRDLVARTAHLLEGGELHEVAFAAFPTPEQQARLASRRRWVSVEGDVLTVVAPDRPGTFARLAGVLALHGVDVVAADAHSSDDGMALSVFRTQGAGATPVDWARIGADVERALDGRLALAARLHDRARAYGPGRRARAAAPVRIEVVWDDAVSRSATVLEVRGPDGIGVLFRVTRALAELDLDIRHAKVQTLGPAVVDAFYLLDAGGARLSDPEHRDEVERAVRHALGATG